MKVRSLSKHAEARIQIRVSALCDEAGIDYVERPIFSLQLFEDIKNECVEGKKEMAEDEALENAFEKFGDPRMNGSFGRDPWHYRLLKYQRCAGARLCVILLATFFVERLWVASGFTIRLTDTWRDLYLYAYMRPSILGLLVIGAVFFRKSREVRLIPLLRWSVITIAAVGFVAFLKSFIELTWLMTGGALSGHLHWYEPLALPLHIFLYIIGWILTGLASLCFVSEVFGWTETASHIKMSEKGMWKFAKVTEQDSKAE